MHDIAVALRRLDGKSPSYTSAFVAALLCVAQLHRLLADDLLVNI